MTRVKSESFGDDAFLRDAEGVEGGAEGGAEEALVGVTETLLGEVQPEPTLRERLLAAAIPADRFARFASAVAQLLQVSVDKAKDILARVDDPSQFNVELPGVSFCWVEGGPALANAVRGFVRVQHGVVFPEHEHFGDETVLILQGSYVDSVTGEVFRPGDSARMSPGSSHGFRVPEGGPDLLQLAVVHKGLRAGDKRYEPR